ncbi:hypothetical protein ASE01_02830 [Nocardioides sp. Root190]|nr:hypothetical protein ASE01_02830 [Nocardioides sp. Root190]
MCAGQAGLGRAGLVDRPAPQREDAVADPPRAGQVPGHPDAVRYLDVLESAVGAGWTVALLLVAAVFAVAFISLVRWYPSAQERIRSW